MRKIKTANSTETDSFKSQILPQSAKVHNESETKNNTIHNIDGVNSYEADGEEKK
jgi:hypothetical protein